MSQSEFRILIVDADPDAAQRVGFSLDAAGFQIAWCNFSPQDLQGMAKDFAPSLLLVHADLGSAELTTLLARIDAAGAASVPIALLCRDVSEERFVRSMRTGVVDMLQEPFDANAHALRLQQLLVGLAARSGVVRGRGLQGELNALLQHVMRTRRTGGLAVGSSDEGRAYFVRGVLKSARFQNQTMQGALAAMSRLTVPWAFTEGAEGTAGVVDLEGDESSYMMTYRDNAAPTRTATAEVLSVQPIADEPFPSQPPAPAPPAATAHASTASVVQATAAPAQVAPAPSAGLSATSAGFLFVDDDPAVVSMLASYFTRKGYPVKTAGDGVEALALLAAQSFDVVVVDLNMPRLDGWGLLRLIREDVRTHEVPVALFSAHEDYRESLRLLHAGAQAYFPKSLRLSALEALVIELVEPRKRFLRNLPPQGGLSFGFGALGPQWVLRALSTARFSGQLDARDAWGFWRAWFEGGRLAQITAKMGTSTFSGDRALCTFLMSKQSEGTIAKEGRAPEEGFAQQPTDATLDRVVPWLNQEQRRAREDQLARARALVPDEELYRLYLTVGPPAWLPVARLLCEQRLTPAEVITRLQVAPADVAGVVKDLLRRGVVTLQT
ncbi:MAG: response regulator [Myxococcaceae bacterium]|nr:response regulator [Myxococcaceae bacterium]MCA3015876.1 response regulator [Myxococcaceae bacterium]